MEETYVKNRPLAQSTWKMAKMDVVWKSFTYFIDFTFPWDEFGMKLKPADNRNAVP